MVSTLQLIIGAVGAAGGLVAVYELVLKKPSLVLEFRLKSEDLDQEPPISEATAFLTPVFYLKNTGRKFAEDPYLEIELEGWNFDPTDVSSDPDTQQIGDPSEGTEAGNAETQALDLTLSEKCDLYGRDLEDIVDIPPATFGPAVIWDSSNAPHPGESEDVDYPVTHLQLRDEELLTRIGAPGEIRKLSIENAIYPDSKFKIFYGGVDLPVNHQYKIRYTVACRGHQPREGYILLNIYHNSIEVQELRSDDWGLRQRRRLKRVLAFFRRKSNLVGTKVY